MGQARGIYTFGAHLRWSWANALGCAASEQAHVMSNDAPLGRLAARRDS